MAPIPESTPATQGFATSVMGPASTGWATQILFAGVAFNMIWSYTSTKAYAADSMRLKLLFWVIVACLLGHTIVSFVSLFHYSTSQQRDAVTLYAQWYSDCFLSLFSGIIGALVQAYMLGRATALFKRKWAKIVFAVSNGLVILGGLLGAMFYLTVSWLQRTDGLNKIPKRLDFNVSIALWGSCCAFVDLVITISLILLLRSRIFGFNARTDGIVRRLMHLAVVTGAPTTFFAIMAASLAFAFPDGSFGTNSAFSWWLPLTSLYACSFVGTLAAREKIREHSVAPGPTTGGNSQLRFSRASPFLQTQSLASVRVDFNSQPPFNDLLRPKSPMDRPVSLSRGNSYLDEVKVVTAETVTAESVTTDSI